MSCSVARVYLLLVSELCHRPAVENLLLSSYAWATLGILAHGNDEVKEKIIEMDALSYILTICKPQKQAAEENGES